MVTTIKHGAAKKSIKDMLENLAKESKSKGVDTHKYVGKINLKEDALNIQKELRNEW